MTCNISLDFILVLFKNPITTSLKLINFVFAKIDLHHMLPEVFYTIAYRLISVSTNDGKYQ